MGQARGHQADVARRGDAAPERLAQAALDLPRIGVGDGDVFLSPAD
jgi:hypothetical protein